MQTIHENDLSNLPISMKCVKVAGENPSKNRTETISKSAFGNYNFYTSLHIKTSFSVPANYYMC